MFDWKINGQILIYDWGGQCQYDLQQFMERADIRGKAHIYSRQLQDYNQDEGFREEFEQLIRQKEIVLCLSFNFFPVISDICQANDILYVSWIYDCPHTSLYSKTVFNSCNLIFTFDRQQMLELQRKGLHQIYHLPLAVNVNRISRLCDSAPQSLIDKYSAQISFVGSLYEQNYYEQIQFLPPELKGYLDGLCVAQMQIYGISILEELLSPEHVEELKQYVKISLGEEYFIEYKELFCELFLKKYISSLERKQILSVLGSHFETVLYSGSDWSCDGVENRGIVAYVDQMPHVFRYSQLNLNLSIRSIRSGIPLRCLDIMGAGGALLSNYQPELAEYFEPDKEWICFQGKDELTEKVCFYLNNSDLRKAIAKKGYEKVKSEFQYEHALRKMFKVVHQYI
ncbi:MAG: glycosyltransferase [Lachnospiraceae bacterium]|nr:glycosyltransferase [Lachnospiraceae bacterium]